MNYGRMTTIADSGDKNYRQQCVYAIVAGR
jgi:hypothetical protein